MPIPAAAFTFCLHSSREIATNDRVCVTARRGSNGRRSELSKLV